MVRTFIGGCAVLLLAGAGGCGDAPPRSGEPAEGSVSTPGGTNDFPLTVIDDEGASVTFERPPGTIVSLVPSATGILRAMDLTDRLVGRTHYDTNPELAHLPSVGGGLEPSPERLISLDPELVLRFAAESDRATPGHLDRAGVPHLAILPDRIEDIRRIIGLLGRVTGRPGAADSLVQAMDRELEEVARAVHGAPRPRAVFLLGGDPPWLVGPGTFLHELLEVAGARNAFEDLSDRYAPVSVEEVIRREPDLLVSFANVRIPRALSGIPVRTVPPEIQAPGHEVAASARVLARTLHPDRLP